MKLVRILLADDHEVVRRGLRALLEAQDGWEVVGEAVTGREAVEKANKLKPDVEADAGYLLSFSVGRFGAAPIRRQRKGSFRPVRRCQRPGQDSYL